MPDAAQNLAELVRKAWNDSAPQQQWIVEIDPDLEHVVVVDDGDRTFSRVPLGIGETVEFGAPVKVLPGYVDAVPVAAARTVFASRAESRPDVTPPNLPEPPNDPTHTPSQGAPTPVTPPASPAPSVPAVAPDAPDSPAAEPEPTTDTQEGDDMSLSGVRSRLGLSDDADEATVLAALDERLTTPTATPTPGGDDDDETGDAEVTRTPELVAASAQYATELKRLSTELAEIKAAKAADVKASVLDTAQGQGKFTPAERVKWEQRYDQAPAVTTDILASLAAGTAVPVAAAGFTGSGEETADLDAEFAGFFPPATFADTTKGV